MKKESVLKSLLFAFAITLSAISSNAQEKKDSASMALYKEIARLDSTLFTAFNKRDTALFKTFFTKDLEFYHDKGGLTGYQHTIDFMNDVSKPGNDLKRDLVKGSLEVYPVPGYGAIQIGVHQFCHTENGKQQCGKFKFIHIWQKINNDWKITRVVSYDH